MAVRILISFGYGSCIIESVHEPEKWVHSKQSSLSSQTHINGQAERDNQDRVFPSVTRSSSRGTFSPWSTCIQRREADSGTARINDHELEEHYDSSQTSHSSHTSYCQSKKTSAFMRTTCQSHRKGICSYHDVFSWEMRLLPGACSNH
jgi:hypothetical protein